MTRLAGQATKFERAGSAVGPALTCEEKGMGASGWASLRESQQSAANTLGRSTSLNPTPGVRASAPTAIASTGVESRGSKHRHNAPRASAESRGKMRLVPANGQAPHQSRPQADAAGNVLLQSTVLEGRSFELELQRRPLRSSSSPGLAAEPEFPAGFSPVGTRARNWKRLETELEF